MIYKNIKIPEIGEKITLKDGVLSVPNNPIIPFIEGDGIGSDITPAMIDVVDAAVEKAYGEKKSISWMEIYCGEKSTKVYGKDEWLPDETLDALREYVVSIKGPLTTPVGGGIRSLNVSLRQILDLYVWLRPVRWFTGVPSPVKVPGDVDMVIFRENSEDIYAGVEFASDSKQSAELVKILQDKFDVDQIRFPKNVGLGVKPISEKGTKRLVRRAFEYAIEQDRSSVTLVHKGNIMKFTEGAFRDWGYELCREEFDGDDLDGGPWHYFINPNNGRKIIVKDVICDAFLQQILLRPREYDVIATMNLNGDYLSDALAAMVGGIGIAPGANIGDEAAMFEATHWTAPKYAGKDQVNPSSVILSGVMMLKYMGWNEAADFVIKAMEKSISEGNVTYDLARGRTDATTLSSSDFAKSLVENIESL